MYTPSLEKDFKLIKTNNITKKLNFFLFII